MRDEIPAYKLMEWYAFLDMRRVGERRMDARLAHLEKIIVNLWRDSKRFPTAFKSEDFEGDFLLEMKEVKRREQTPQEKMSLIFEKLAGFAPGEAPTQVRVGSKAMGDGASSGSIPEFG